MNYENEDFGQRLIDGHNMEDMDYSPISESDGFHIINPISETFAAQLSDEITTEWEADFQPTKQIDRVNGTVITRTQFDVVSHALSKDIGGCVRIGKDAERRARHMKTCPLLAQAKRNSEEAEARLKNARDKDFPEEAKPEDQFKHLPLTDEQVIDAVDEFLSGCEVTSNNEKNMTASTLFTSDRGDGELTMVRDVVRACIYAYVTQGKRANRFFGTSSIRSFQPAFLDWYYNFQHYAQGEFHMYFSDFYQILLEKTCKDA